MKKAISLNYPKEKKSPTKFRKNFTFWSRSVPPMDSDIFRLIIRILHVKNGPSHLNQ